MFRGKKGFDRLIYACKNVFDKPVSWLFCRADPKGQFYIMMAAFLLAFPAKRPHCSP